MYSNNSNKPIVARHFEQLDSTNAEAIRQLRSADNPPQNFTVITAAHQTAGRGQAGNGWHDTPGQNALASLIYYPKQLAVADLFVLTQLSSLAVVDTIERTLKVKAIIKWPNDIYVEVPVTTSIPTTMVNKVAKPELATARKIAGLLLQNSLMGQGVQWSIIGIGLNVNESDFPQSLKATATSMKLLNQRQDVDLATIKTTLFATLRTNIQHYLDPLKRQELQTAYLARLYRLDQEADYLNVATNTTFQGIIRGVTDAGYLQVEHRIGRIQQYGLKEIAFL